MSNSGADGGLGRGMDDDVNPPTRTTMPAHALPLGTRIRDYQILGLLGEGGFGIVYLAMDVLLERQVAIKEYLPTSIAWRGTGNLQVAVRVARDQDTFALGLRSFVNEARLLARFDHPSLIKVHRFWEENGTAYMVMPFYRGRTLQRTLERLGRRPTEAELRAWLAPLMDALQVMHAEKCYHRDISPDNVLITESGPMLLDFGAARRVIGDVQRALTVVLKPGFAPIEQYGDTPGLKQGAWTDVYALAGMLFAAITSRRPPPAVARLMDDPMPKVGEVAVGQYSAAFLQAIDRGLALMPKDRPQSVAEFRALMDDPDYVAPPGEPAVTAPVDLDLTLESPLPPPPLPPPAISAGAPARTPPRVKPPAPPTEPPARADHRPRQAALATHQRLALLVAALALLALLGLGYSLYRDSQGGATSPDARPEPALPPASAAAQPAALPLPPASAPAPDPAPAAAPASAPPSAPPSVPASAAAVPGTAPPSTPAIEAPAADTPATFAAPASAPAAARPARPTRPPAGPAAATQRPAPAPDEVARCSDILKKGSLEPLTAAETAFLRRHCQ
ncbi:MAG: serine/threonine protein kinase [Rubrivivax sp.]|nr:serine/threonine protein kinase [Rubrivivax sp.]